MKNSPLATVIAAALLTGCSASHQPQLTEMPQGPLLSYQYEMMSRTGGGLIQQIAIWHDDSTRQGLLSFEGQETPTIGDHDIPSPMPVGEEVFDSLYQVISQSRLYLLDRTYGKTYFVDAYAYPEWNLKAVFPHATISSTSEGEEPDMDTETFHRTNKFLADVARKQGLEWLHSQPIDLHREPYFSNMDALIVMTENEESDTTSIVYQLTEWPSGVELTTASLKPLGNNRYKDETTGNTWEPRWVEDELTLTCRSPKGAPLWATRAHNNATVEWNWDRQVYHLLTGIFTDEQGRQVTIGRDHIKGFLGHSEESLRLQNYKDLPAFRFVVGDYPEERFYGFIPTPDGLDIYHAEIDPDWVDDGRSPDYLLTTQAGHLQRTTDDSYDWLHSELLDSHYAKYFNPQQRQQMLSVVESPAEPTPQDQWNAWVLHTF